MTITHRMTGTPLATARLAVVAAHGRGGSAADMAQLAELVSPSDVAWVLPEVADRSWWPKSFLAPIAENEPQFSKALGAVESAVQAVLATGMTPDRVLVMGFSQGACLALEHAARAGRRYRGVVALSGGLVGTGEAGGAPDSALYGHGGKHFNYPHRLDGVLVYIGCHEQDPHIPLARVERSAEVFEELGATMKTDIFPGAGHGLVDAEITYLKAALG